MPSAYVLINCEYDSEEEIIKELSKLPELVEVYQAYGSYDLIAKVSTDTIDKLKETIGSSRLAAKEAPDLVALVTSGALPPSQLTFAAEAVGRINNSVLVRDTLLPLLKHASAVVREGAIYGLSNHLDDDARDVIKLIAQSDPSLGVRAAAAELLDD